MSRVTDMTSGNIAARLLSFSFPLILSNIGQQLYMIADASIVGLGLGVRALAAVGATDWCYWLFLWTVIGTTGAFATFISRYFGNRDTERMNRALGASIRLCAVIAVVVTAVGLLSAWPLLRLLNTPSDIIGQSATYLLTMLAGMPIVFAYNMAASILRALGDGKTPLFAMLIAAVLNVGLDLVFVLALPFGVFGAAAASLISQLFAFLYCFLRIRKTEGIDLSHGRGRPLPGMQREMLMLALPIALQYIVLSLGGIVLQSTVNVQGSVFVAGYTATTKLYGLLEAVSIALGMAFATFTAQNYGAGNFGRIKKGVYVSSLLCFLFALLFGALVLFLGEGMLSLFLDKGDPATPLAMPIALRFLRILGAFLFILYLIHIFRNVLQSMGISRWSLLSGFSECAVRILMAKVFILPFSTDALFFAEPTAWLGALLTVCIPYFFYQAKWKKDKKREDDILPYERG